MDSKIFRNELQSLINSHSLENGSDTPDFILAQYIGECLEAFDKATKAREKWYGREAKLVPPEECPESPPTGP